jgi:hypothetical protein
VFAAESRQTRDQFRRRFTIPPASSELVSLLALDLDEYRLPAAEAAAARESARAAAGEPTPRILVLGNHFHHKYLNPTANALAEAFPERIVVALGPDYHGAHGKAGPRDPVPFITAPNLRIMEVGALAEQDISAEYEAADVVVFPSHAEGFGFPVLRALAARRPIFVRRLPVFEEIWQATGYDPNLHFYESTTDLIARLQSPPARQPHATPPPGNGAERNAREIHAAMMQALAKPDYHRIVRRIRAVQLPSALAHRHEPPPPSDTKAALAARHLALKVERVALRILRVQGLYVTIRLALYPVRHGWRWLRRG